MPASSWSDDRDLPRQDRRPDRNDVFDREDDIASRRIYIAGVGSIGKFMAHSLRGIPEPPPVTLVLYKKSLLEAWKGGPRQISLTTEDVTIPHTGYDVELSVPPPRRHGEEVGPGQGDKVSSGLEDLLKAAEAAARREREAHTTSDIFNLIVAVKAHQTVGVLSGLRKRLTPESTILFLQNGMGIIEEVNEKVFPDPLTRPQYMVGITTHGVTANSIWHATHAGYGTISLGLVPTQRAADTSPTRAYAPSQIHDNKLSWKMSSRYLLRTLARVPVLAAVGLPFSELLKVQLEKLAINAVISPLTVALDCRNGSLLYNYALTRLSRLLISEISLVVRGLPELRGLPNIAARFSPERLETLVVAVAHATRHNISSMLADVRLGRQTEARYITGYVVKRGEEQGIACVVNYAMMQMVLAKKNMVEHELKNDTPVLEAPEPLVPQPKDQG